MVLKVEVPCLILLLILFINGGSSKPTPEYPRTLPQLDNCGQQEIEPIFREERIVNGGRAADHSWPWQASLYGEFKTSGGIEYWYQCGGAIVNDQWILTAAHCFVYPDVIQLQKWVIHVGERYNDFLSETVQIRDLESFVIHQEFIYTIRKNDLALLKLSSPLKFNAYVHPICFPPAHEELPEDAFCVVAGFAHNDNRMIERGAPLHQLITPIIPRDNCSSEEFYGGTLKDHMFCSGLIDGKRDTCQGDSGRPLMCLKEDRWTAVGILSYGRNCGIPKKPGVYTKLSSYIPWITKTIHGAKARTALNHPEGLTNAKRQLEFDVR